MSRKGSPRILPLHEVARWTKTIEIRCNKCRRYGRVSNEKALERYGSDKDLWDLVLEAADNCPNRWNVLIADVCEAESPTYAQVPENGRG